MKWAGVSMLAVVTLWAFFMALGWENCRDIGLFDQRCNKGSTENCIDTCGGRPFAVKSARLCLDKPRLIFKLGDSVRGAVSCDLEHQLKGAFYFDVVAKMASGPKLASSGEVCNQGNRHQLCNTTKLRWNITSLLIQENWRSYVGHVHGKLQLSDEDGLFLCLNISATLQD